MNEIKSYYQYKPNELPQVQMKKQVIQVVKYLQVKFINLKIYLNQEMQQKVLLLVGLINYFKY